MPVRTSKTNVRALVLRLGVLLCLAGCNYPMQSADDLVSTAVAATLAPATATAPAPPSLLPASLLFLSERNGVAQIWQLAADGETETQLSDEAHGVDSFDVSPLDGSLAYVSDNQLYLRDADGGNRRLMVDNAAADREAAEFAGLERISSPQFSADGRYLAYAYGGLWILDLDTNQAVHLLNNEIDPDSEAVQAYYAPLLWAPDGPRLALVAGELPESRLAFLNPEGETLVTLAEAATGPACCHPAWTPDGAGLLMASPYAGLVEPGLWQYEAQTGARERLLAEEEGLIGFAGWPWQTADGTLYYFYASAAEPPGHDVPLFMVRSPADAPNARQALREEAFTNVGEVLWAADGALALVVQLRPEGGRGGAVLLAHTDGQQPVRLLEDGYALQWGQ